MKTNDLATLDTGKKVLFLDGKPQLSVAHSLLGTPPKEVK
jgi:hypothetical protein